MKIYVGFKSVSADAGEDRVILAGSLDDGQRVFICDRAGEFYHVVKVGVLRDWAKLQGKEVPTQMPVQPPRAKLPPPTPKQVSSASVPSKGRLVKRAG